MDEDEQLAKAYGELARGFKRLRNVHRTRVRDRKSPDSSDSGLSVPDEPGSGLSVPEEPPDFFLKNYGIKRIDFALSPKEFLTTPRSMAFGRNFPSYLIQILLCGLVRGGMCGNYWVADSTQPHGWRRIGERQMKGVLHMLETFHSSCNLLLGGTYEDFVKNVGPLTTFKWARRDLIADSALTWDQLRQFARGEHRRLPSVCGSRAEEKSD